MGKIENHFREQVNESANYFEQWLYPSKNEFWKKNLNKDISNNIYQEKLECLSLDDKKSYKHNCIPCNLNSSANIIWQFLNNHKECAQIEYFLQVYTLLFYTHVEKCAVIYVELGFVKKGTNDQFDWEQFPSFQKIKYWANFFKHPKSFMYVHHPVFYLDSHDFPSGIMRKTINTEFVKKYFSGGKKNEELSKNVSNQDANVFYPNLIEFTKELCFEFEKLINLINSNLENQVKLKEFRK